MNPIYHNIDPIIFSFNVGDFTFALRWYALSYIAGLLFAWKFMQVLVGKPNLWRAGFAPLKKSEVEDLMTYMILGVILGGRLGYVCFYKPLYFLENPIEIFMIWKGGMSFHGGFLGVVIAAVFYAKRKNCDLIAVGDLIAVASPPGLLFGRLANFINGELWGKPTSSALGIVFPSKAAQTCPAAWEGICTRHPSQLYEALLEGFLLWLIMLFCIFYLKSLDRRGETICSFLIGYGISRFVVEIFREPDSQFVSVINPNGYIFSINDSFGLSMGQILSLPMIFIGVTYILFINVSKSKIR